MISLSLFIVLVCSFTSQLVEAQNEHLIIDAGELGRVSGLQLWTSQTQRPFLTFHGIPYAHDTAKPNRFKPSTLKTGPLTEDGSIFYATNGWNMCPQNDILRGRTELNVAEVFKAAKEADDKQYEAFLKGEKYEPHIDGTEDCLVLNINTPMRNESTKDDKYPVIFFVHGGSSEYVFGTPFTGLRLLEHDVVLVTINYRLGILGALNLGIDDAPGNAAMYDSVNALKWVQRYIHHFGGDPDKVTLYGHSAGGMMVTHLLASPMAKGLFHGVIGASGSALSCWGTAAHPSISWHLRVSEMCGCFDPATPEDEIDYQDIADCMQDVSLETLISVMGTHGNEEMREGRLGFDAKVPSIQSPSLTIEPFMTEHPFEIFKRGDQSPVPVLMGALRHDGSFALESMYNKYIRHHDLENNSTFLRNDLLPILLTAMGFEDTSAGGINHALGRTYFGPEAMVSGNFTKMIPGLVDLFSVFGFKAGAYGIVEFQAKVNPHSYYYAFDYRGIFTAYNQDRDEVIPGDVNHVDDMFYAFQAYPLILKEEREFSKRYIQYLVNFAYYGDPNGPEGSEIVFPAFNDETHPFIVLNREDSVGYYCRDTWINNALELMDDYDFIPTTMMTPSTTTPTTTRPTTEDTTTTPPVTTDNPPVTTDNPPVTTNDPPVTSHNPPGTSEQPPATSDVTPTTEGTTTTTTEGNDPNSASSLFISTIFVCVVQVFIKFL